MLLGFGLQLVLAASLSSSEAANALLQGRVLDGTHAPIARAHVTARAAGEQGGPSAETDDLGEFTIAAPPRDYTVIVTAPGFRQAAQRMKASDAAGHGLTEFVLEVAGVTETVEVTS